MGEQHYISEGVTLDLTGFQRRVPARLLQWHLGQLRVAEQAVIAVSNDLDVKRLLTELSRCGAEVYGEYTTDDASYYQICKGANSTTVELDVRGLRCPFPVIEARHRLQRLSPHALLHLITDCTAATREIGTWAARNPQVALLGRWQERGSEQVFLLGKRYVSSGYHA